MGAICTAIFVILSAAYLGACIERLVEASKDPEPIVAPVPTPIPSMIVSNLVQAGLSSTEIFNGAEKGFFLAATLSDPSLLGGEGL